VWSLTVSEPLISLWLAPSSNLFAKKKKYLIKNWVQVPIQVSKLGPIEIPEPGPVLDPIVVLVPKPESKIRLSSSSIFTNQTR